MSYSHPKLIGHNWIKIKDRPSYTSYSCDNCKCLLDVSKTATLGIWLLNHPRTMKIEYDWINIFKSPPILSCGEILSKDVL